MSQVGYVVAWWLTLQLFGLAALPLAQRVFANLPDRGWAFARPAGLLAAGFLFWQGATFGLLANTWASIFGALLVVAIASWALCWREAVQLRAFVQTRRAHILAVEALFTLMFLFWVVVRAFNPEISGTEKPMEIAFLNGVLRSDHFPPLDPWLSGYAISYYYFGYIITAMLARFSAVPPEFAFNLMLPTLFALTATGAYTIGSAMYAGSRGAAATARRTIASGLLSVLMVLFLGNLEPVLETLNAHQALPDSARAYFAIKDMVPPYEAKTLFPSDDFMWWWRSTRVIGTQSPAGQKALDYTITEFPYFSFIHADLHPHVLALPFALVAIGFALNLLRTPGELSLARLRRDPWTLGSTLVLFGGLGFLNAWDLPTFLFLLALAFGTHRVLTRGVLDRQVVREVAYGLPAAMLLSVVIYLPFWLTLRSQASGFGVVITHSQIQHFLLFWGPLYLTVATFLVTQLAATWRSVPSGDWTSRRLFWAITLVVAAAAAALQAPAVGLTLPLLAASVALWSRHTLAPGVPLPVASEMPRRRTSPRRREPVEIAGAAVPIGAPREHLFAFLMAFTALLLVFGCELLYIRDLFGDRMNTVFKLYYQAWPLMALAAAYAIPLMLGQLGRLAPAVRTAAAGWGAVMAVTLAAGLIFPYAVTFSKTRNFSGEPTLDGYAFWGRARPDDLAGIQWLRQNVDGAPVIVEAVGGSYQDQFARVSRMTGLPTLLGWEFHEQQWRGNYAEQGLRKPDVEQIYTSTDAKNVQALLDKYKATYVYVGPTERETYRTANLDRFAQFMDVVFKQGTVTIYRVRGR